MRYRGKRFWFWLFDRVCSTCAVAFPVWLLGMVFWPLVGLRPLLLSQLIVTIFSAYAIGWAGRLFQTWVRSL